MRKSHKTTSQNATDITAPDQNCIFSLKIATDGCFLERTQSLEVTYQKIVCLEKNILDLALFWLLL